MAPPIFVCDGLKLKAVERDAGLADRDFGQVGADDAAKMVTRHAKVRRGSGYAHPLGRWVLGVHGSATGSTSPWRAG